MRINRCTNLSFTGIAATPLIYGYLYGSFFQDHPGPMSRPYTAVNLRSCHTRLQTELVPPPVFRYHLHAIYHRGLASHPHTSSDTSAPWAGGRVPNPHLPDPPASSLGLFVKLQGALARPTRRSPPGAPALPLSPTSHPSPPTTHIVLIMYSSSRACYSPPPPPLPLFIYRRAGGRVLR